MSADDDDGIELKFLRSTKSHKNKDPKRLAQYLDRVSRSGESDINRRLSEVLEAYRHQCSPWFNGNEASSSRLTWFRRLPSKPKKLSVYVLTDAVWQNRSDPRESISHMVDKLVQWQCCADLVGIQFIRFGDNAESIAKLQRLDSRLGLQR